jgi:sugar phosphate isomerase/epimerase
MFSALGITNLAWPAADLDEALALVQALGFRAVEIAPFNVFGRWDVSAQDVQWLREKLERHGLSCIALQGIAFQVPGTELFASPESRARLAAHFAGVAAMAGALGARACVYGAAKHRDPGNLSAEQARETAVSFFRSVGPVFAREGATLAFEANARSFGCRFMWTTASAIELVKSIDSEGIGLQIDTGTIFAEGESLDVLIAAVPQAVHAHISEPQLSPIGATGADHHAMAAAFRKAGYTGSVSIEMRPADDWRSAIRNATSIVQAHYT